MALITDLPAATSLATTDLLVKDTGSATQKIAVSNAYADATHAGLVSTGTQTMAGNKTLQGMLTIVNTRSNGMGFITKVKDATNGEQRIGAAYQEGALSGNAHWIFEQRSQDASGNVLSYSEKYLLPDTDVGRTSNASYTILTTKPSSPVLCYKGVASGDMNDYDQIGVWAIGSTALTNGPTGGTWCYFMVLAGNTTVQQICFTSGMNLYVRSKTGNPPAWTAWKALYPA